MGLKGTAHVALLAWWEDFTFNEAHAFTIGFAPAFFALLTWRIGLIEIATGLFALVALLFAIAYQQREATSPALGILPNNVWYFGGGAVLGAIAARLLFG